MMASKVLALALLALSIAVLSPSCGTSSTPSRGVEETTGADDLEEMKRVQEQHQDELFKIQGVHTVMIGQDVEGRNCIVVKVEPGTPKRERAKIPEKLEGFPVCVEEEPAAGIQ
jgi:hypothetical protein